MLRLAAIGRPAAHRKLIDQHPLNFDHLTIIIPGLGHPTIVIP